MSTPKHAPCIACGADVQINKGSGGGHPTYSTHKVPKGSSQVSLMIDRRNHVAYGGERCPGSNQPFQRKARPEAEHVGPDRNPHKRKNARV